MTRDADGRLSAETHPLPALGPEVRGQGDPRPRSLWRPRGRSCPPLRLPGRPGLCPRRRLDRACAGSGRGRAARYTCPLRAAGPRPPLGPRGARGAQLCRGWGQGLEGSRVLACPQDASQARASTRPARPRCSLRPCPAAPASPGCPSVCPARRLGLLPGGGGCLSPLSECVCGGSPVGGVSPGPSPLAPLVLPPERPRPGPLCPFSCVPEQSHLTTNRTARCDLVSGLSDHEDLHPAR